MAYLSENILESLFESAPKIRLLKLFVRNPGQGFTMREVRERTKLGSGAATKALREFERIAFVKKKSGRFSAHRAFIFFTELQAMVVKSFPLPRKKIIEDVSRLGRIKLIVIAGVFLNAERKRVDVLVVGNKIREKGFESFIKNLEAEVGQELSWTALPAEEFKYRYKMFDRFIRDIFEYPHEILLDKLGVKK